MFEVIVRKEFAAEHALRDYHGGMEESHEHDWLCEVRVRGRDLDQSGCAIDFGVVDAALADAISSIEGKALHDTPHFADISPSTEHIARYIYKFLATVISTDGHCISEVTVWEDDGHGASYHEEEKR